MAPEAGQVLRIDLASGAVSLLGAAGIVDGRTVLGPDFGRKKGKSGALCGHSLALTGGGRVL